jgi:hypothetical protein
MSNSSKSNSLFISYNDSVTDLIRTSLFAKACEFSSINFSVLINSSKEKRSILEKLKINFCEANKFSYLINFFDGLFLSKFVFLLKIPRKYREIFFKATVLTNKNRKASISDLNLLETFIYRIIFLIKLNIFISIFYRKILSRNINQVICEERSKMPEVLFYYLALRNKIDYIQFTNGNLRSSLIFKRLKTSNSTEHPLSISGFKEIYNTFCSSYVNELNSISSMFEYRYKSNEWYDRDKIIGKIQSISSSSNYNFKFSEHSFVVVIFPHIFWDATFAYGEDIFEDYKDWFESTCKCLANISKLKIIIRPHPDLEWKKKLISNQSFDHIKYFKSFVGALKKKSKSDFILLPANSNIDALSLIKLANCILTVRGTVGLEAACFGVPTVTCGTSRYSNLGFTIDSVSKSDYYNNIENIKKIKKLSALKIRKAKFLAYLLFRLKPILISSFETFRFSSFNLDNKNLLTIMSSEQLKNDVLNSNLHIFLRSNKFDLFNKKSFYLKSDIK